MKANKLIYIFLLMVLTGFSSQSFAVLVSMNAEGTVNNYSFAGDVDPFGGAISLGDSFSSASVFDDGIISDTNSSEGIGRYRWEGGSYTTFALAGSTDFNTQDTTILIYNNSENGAYDRYQINSWIASGNNMLFFSIVLTDSSAQAFNSDSFVLEPDLNLFDSSYFMIREYDSQGAVNFSISGDLTSLVDPPLDTASVPEPGTIFLLGLGLIAVFFASKKGQREEEVALTA